MTRPPVAAPESPPVGAGSLIESLLRHDRRLVAALLAAVAGLAWIYTLLAPGMPDMDGGAAMGMSDAQHDAMLRRLGWTPGYAVLMFFMWWIMMVAMMVPAAAPMVLLFAAVNRKQKAANAVSVPTGLFLGGYLAAWAGFSLAATGAQWALERSGLLSPMMMRADGWLAAALLLAAGLYQVTLLKQACLRHCRNPISFVTQHWRPGRSGAWRMGLEHGIWCLGCCWFLMALLFVGGVMNVLWIAAIAAYVYLEKSVPHGHWLSYASGIVLIAAGLWVGMTAFGLGAAAS